MARRHLFLAASGGPVGELPGGNHWRGEGLYIDYGDDDAFVKHIVTLSGGGNRRATSSFSIHQGSPIPATDLHYVAYTDVPVRSYTTDIDREGTLTVVEDLTRPGGGEIDVDWDFPFTKPAFYCADVKVRTEFTMDDYNSVAHRDIGFTYPDIPFFVRKAPNHGWKIDELELTGGELQYEGYVIGAYDLVWNDPQDGANTIVPFRLQHQFGMTDNREDHPFHLFNPDIDGSEAFELTNLRFGYSDGYRSTEQLWDFDEWLVTSPLTHVLRPGEEFSYLIQFSALPYYREACLPRIPEPPSAVLLLLGAAAVAMLRRAVRSRV